MLAELADRADDSSLISVARSEVPKLTDAWRSLLAAHEPDARGNCPECSTRWRQQKSPCAVWRAAHEHLVGGALAPRPRRASGTRAQAGSPSVGRSRHGRAEGPAHARGVAAATR